MIQNKIIKKIYFTFLFKLLIVIAYGQNNTTASEHNKNVIVTANLKGLNFNIIPIHIVDEFIELKKIIFDHMDYNSANGEFKGSFMLENPRLLKFFYKDVFVTPGDSIHLQYLVLDTLPEYKDTLIITGANELNYEYFKFFKGTIKKYDNTFPKYSLPFTSRSFERYKSEVITYYEILNKKIVSSFVTKQGTEVYKRFVLSQVNRVKQNTIWRNVTHQNRSWIKFDELNKIRRELLANIDQGSKEFNEALIILHKLLSNEKPLNFTIQEFRNLERNASTFSQELKQYLITSDIIEFLNKQRNNDPLLINEIQSAAKKIKNPLYKSKLLEYDITNLEKNESLSLSEKNIKLITLDNKAITLNTTISKSKTRHIYIDFWASWCGPCRSQSPYLNTLIKKFKENGIDFIQISCDEDKNLWRKAVKTDSVNLPESYCFDNKIDFLAISKKFKITGVPYYLIVDGAGKIKVKNAPRPSEINEISEIFNKLRVSN